MSFPTCHLPRRPQHWYLCSLTTYGSESEIWNRRGNINASVVLFWVMRFALRRNGGEYRSGARARVQNSCCHSIDCKYDSDNGTTDLQSTPGLPGVRLQISQLPRIYRSKPLPASQYYHARSDHPRDGGESGGRHSKTAGCKQPAALLRSVESVLAEPAKSGRGPLVLVGSMTSSTVSLPKISLNEPSPILTLKRTARPWAVRVRSRTILLKN